MSADTRYPWATSPAWAQFAATDENGRQAWFEVRPEIRSVYGLPECWVQALGNWDEGDLAESPCPDWRDSLEPRPAPSGVPELPEADGWMMGYAKQRDPTCCGNSFHQCEAIANEKKAEMIEAGCIAWVTPYFTDHTLRAFYERGRQDAGVGAPSSAEWVAFRELRSLFISTLAEIARAPTVERIGGRNLREDDGDYLRRDPLMALVVRAKDQAYAIATPPASSEQEVSEVMVEVFAQKYWGSEWGTAHGCHTAGQMNHERASIRAALTAALRRGKAE